MSDENVVGRDEFQRMLRDAENGRFDCLLVWEIDRFGRERQDIPTGKMTLKRAGVKPHIDLLQYQRKRTALACSSAVQMVEAGGANTNRPSGPARASASMTSSMSTADPLPE